MKKIEEMELSELKVLAYDQITILNNINRNIQIIENEINKRATESKVEESKVSNN